MIKIFFFLLTAGLFAGQVSFASEQDPLTPGVKAKLHSQVITIVAEGFLTPEGVAKVKEKGPAYVAMSRSEPGNIQYQLQFEATDPGHIFWYEQYASPAAFDKHVNSDYSKAWVAMLKPLSTKPIVIHFLNKIEHIETNPGVP
jgi:quinol monooxygenase YgiN